MNVAELIEELSKYGPEHHVYLPEDEDWFLLDSVVKDGEGIYLS